MVYRPDIDGLRALAVLSVLLFHAGVPGVPGGFVGVDVFFVISGFLICGMIESQIHEQNFSLGNFYKRRIMRIFPALAVVMIATSVVSYRYYLPIELNDYALSLVAAAFSVSNIYFAYTTGYFDAPALTKPLLHTWSLGVEEQFYFVIPLIILYTTRLIPGYLRTVLIIALALSLIVAVYGFHYHPAKAFYLTPCRTWELVLGALLSNGAQLMPASKRLRDLVSIAGLTLILGIVFLAPSYTPVLTMTGLASLGAALIISSSSGGHLPSFAGHLLAFAPVRFVGLISYSVYLWHWPIIVFERSGAVSGIDLPLGTSQVIVIVLSLVAGAASWFFIETPFRISTAKTQTRVVFGVSSATTFALCCIGFAFVKLEGVPSRFSHQVLQLAAYLGYDSSTAYRHGQCYLTSDRQSFDEALCLNVTADRPNYLLVGDSFAAHLWLGLSKALPNVNILQASMGQCRPVIAATWIVDSGACLKFRNLIFDKFLGETKVGKVLLAAAWKNDDVAYLLDTIDYLRVRGITTVVIGPLVEYERPLPRLLADEILRNDPLLAQRMRSAEIPVRDRMMKALVMERGADYVSVYDAACPNGVCREITEDGIPIQFDTGHLTAEGSIAIGLQLATSSALTN